MGLLVLRDRIGSIRLEFALIFAVWAYASHTEVSFGSKRLVIESAAMNFAKGKELSI